MFFQHFVGNLDDHDPALSDGFATDREVILFNNTGVASTSGLVPDTIEQMATDAAAFIDALGLTTVDLVGHSMGGLVAQQVAIQRPDLVRKLVLVGTGRAAAWESASWRRPPRCSASSCPGRRTCGCRSCSRRPRPARSWAASTSSGSWPARTVTLPRSASRCSPARALRSTPTAPRRTRPTRS
nr:alpha/beta hydrolase [Streptomyces sp. S1D4-11]